MPNAPDLLGEWGNDFQKLLAYEKLGSKALANILPKDKNGGTVALTASTPEALAVADNYSVVEMLPDKSKPLDKFLFAGTETGIAHQISLFQALYKLIGSKGNFDFSTAFSNFHYQWQGVAYNPNQYQLDRAQNPLYKNSALPWGFPIDSGKDNSSSLPAVNILNSPGRNSTNILIEFLPQGYANPDQSYLIEGSPEQVYMEVQRLHNMWMMLDSSNLMAFLGYPVDEFFQKAPRNNLTLHFILCPDKNGGRQIQINKFSVYRSEVTIPFVNSAKITYDLLRTICGGDEGLRWGQWKAISWIGQTDKSPLKGASQIWVSGNTKESAIANLEAFLQLTSGVELNRTTTQTDITKGIRAGNPRYQVLQNYPMYPGWVHALNPTIASFKDSPDKGKQNLYGKQISNGAKFNITNPKEPPGWMAKFANLLKATH